MRLVTVALCVAGAAAGVEPVRQLDMPASAEACGRCHRAIQEAWQGSAHAQAMQSRLFQDALELTENEFGRDSRRTCLGCHSPIAARVGDMRLYRKVSWEGVTCDYCHSVKEVTLDGNPKARVEFTLVKTGPIEKANSNGHQTAYSAVHVSSTVCAPCHQYENPLGFPVLTTFGEWRKSRYSKEGKNCQSCHMHVVAGDVVDPLITNVPRAKVNLHLMPGGHSIEQLAGTVRAQLAAVREADKLRVNLDVVNARAGHYVPTGSPMRQIIVEVRADSYDGQHFKEQRVYRRVVAGQDGKEIEREPLAFMRAAKVLSDTRLAPDEKRRETFLFPIPAKTAAQVSATFWYYYSPLARTEAQKRVTFLAVQQLVK
jgi:hypothetical protein